MNVHTRPVPLALAISMTLSLFGCQSTTLDPAATRPTGRDLDGEGLQLSRRLTSLSDSTIRVYDAPDGQFVVDEKQTFTRQGLLQYLARQEPKHLAQGIVYFLNQGDIKDKATFVEVKAFCIQHNVNFYLSEGNWSQRPPIYMLDPAIHLVVTWIIQARP